MLLSIACLRGFEFGPPRQHDNTTPSRDMRYTSPDSASCDLKSPPSLTRRLSEIKTSAV